MFSSSKSGSGYKGISRVRTYEFTHPDVPTAFDGFRIAFISDLHYRSLFKEKGLANLVKLLNNQHADALLIGVTCMKVANMFSPFWLPCPG